MAKTKKDIFVKNEYPSYYVQYPQMYKQGFKQNFKRKLWWQSIAAVGILGLFLAIIHGDIGTAQMRQGVLKCLRDDDALAIAEVWVRDGAKYVFTETVAADGDFYHDEAEISLPVYGVVVSSFGWQKRTESFNKGIVIETEGKEALRAMTAGLVTEIKKDGEYYTIVIEGDGGIVCIYANCTDVQAKIGMSVAKGEIIAYSGEQLVSKGRVYVELTHYGEPIDPLGYAEITMV